MPNMHMMTGPSNKLRYVTVMHIYLQCFQYIQLVGQDRGPTSRLVVIRMTSCSAAADIGVGDHERKRQ
jgi:hypothetical protein